MIAICLWLIANIIRIVLTHFPVYRALVFIKSDKRRDWHTDKFSEFCWVVDVVVVFFFVAVSYVRMSE